LYSKPNDATYALFDASLCASASMAFPTLLLQPLALATKDVQTVGSCLNVIKCVKTCANINVVNTNEHHIYGNIKVLYTPSFFMIS